MNKSLILKSLVIPAAFLLIVSCKKKESFPIADFSFDKSSYKEGETMRLKNTSSNAARVRWVMPDGQTKRSDEVEYFVETLGIARIVSFRLEAISESGLLEDYTVKHIGVAP